MLKLANKFEIGCDPEFAVVDGVGAVVNVAALGDHPAGPVAADHGGLCAELHPEKARGAWTLVKRMQQILFEHPKLADFRAQRWRGGGLYEAAAPPKVPLGGHIHFNLGIDVWPAGATEALDRVTKFLEGLDALPTGECQARRKHSHHGTTYGHYGDIRYGYPYNNDGHIEYRTMASWLFHPWTAMLALTLAKLAVVDPQVTLAKLAGGPDFKKLVNLLEAFRNKDINADRLLEKFERSTKWLSAKPDLDIKETWSGI